MCVEITESNMQMKRVFREATRVVDVWDSADLQIAIADAQSICYNLLCAP